MKKRSLISGIGLVLLVALGEPPCAAAQEKSARDAAQAAAAFGIDLYGRLAAKEGNVFFSPYSTSEALALLSAGANGKTRQELIQTLHWTGAPDEMAASFAAQDQQLARAAQGGAVLSVANGLWYQQGASPREAFLNISLHDYRAEVRAADFIGNASAVGPEINGWVEQKTGGKIVDLFPAGALTKGTRLVLANAIYFKGKWEHTFDAGRTAPRPFYTASDRSVPAPLMASTSNLRTVTVDECDLLELPYMGGELSMVILLPKARDGLPSLEQHLSSANLLLWLASLDSSMQREVEVELPRFKASYSAELTSPLEGLGVSAAFSPGVADFSPLDGRRDLYVSTVVHKAYVDVNEEGTEAAAATGIGVTTFAIERPLRFTVDHPFLLLIRDNVSGSLLFFGRIMDPTQT